MDRLRRFAKLSMQDRLGLAQAFGLLCIARALASRVVLQSVRRPQQAPPTGSTLARAQEVARLVHIAARYVPADRSCLHRALTLWVLLRGQTIEACLRIGVRKGDAVGVIDAHAWVEVGGVPVGEAPDVTTRYAVLGEPLEPVRLSLRALR